MIIGEHENTEKHLEENRSHNTTTLYKKLRFGIFPSFVCAFFSPHSGEHII